MRNGVNFGSLHFLYHEETAIVARIKKGYANGQKTKQKIAQNVFVGKPTLCKGRLKVKPVNG